MVSLTIGLIPQGLKERLRREGIYFNCLSPMGTSFPILATFPRDSLLRFCRLALSEAYGDFE